MEHAHPYEAQDCVRWCVWVTLENWVKVEDDDEDDEDDDVPVAKFKSAKPKTGFAAKARTLSDAADDDGDGGGSSRQSAALAAARGAGASDDDAAAEAAGPPPLLQQLIEMVLSLLRALAAFVASVLVPNHRPHD